MSETAKIVIASDQSGFTLKEAVRIHIVAHGYDVTDVGQQRAEDPMPYFEAATALAKAIQTGGYARGIVICGTGAGVSLIANKFRGVYCVPCESIYTAQRTALVNNANVLAMGEQVVSQAMACEMALQWLKARWCEGFDPARRERNQKGFAILQALEAENFSP